MERPHNLFILLILQELEHLLVVNLQVEVLDQVLALLLKQVKVEEVQEHHHLVEVQEEMEQQILVVAEVEVHLEVDLVEMVVLVWY